MPFFYPAALSGLALVRTCGVLVLGDLFLLLHIIERQRVQDGADFLVEG